MPRSASLTRDPARLPRRTSAAQQRAALSRRAADRGRDRRHHAPGSSANARIELRRLAVQAGIRRRFAPHQLRHAHAVELAREGVPLNVIQCQLGHDNLGTTSIYLQGIDTEEIIATVYARRAPMMSATAGLQL
jgi:integrase